MEKEQLPNTVQSQTIDPSAFSTVHWPAAARQGFRQEHFQALPGELRGWTSDLLPPKRCPPTVLWPVPWFTKSTQNNFVGLGPHQSDLPGLGPKYLKDYLPVLWYHRQSPFLITRAIWAPMGGYQRKGLFGGGPWIWKKSPRTGSPGTHSDVFPVPGEGFLKPLSICLILSLHALFSCCFKRHAALNLCLRISHFTALWNNILFRYPEPTCLKAGS